MNSRRIDGYSRNPEDIEAEVIQLMPILSQYCKLFPAEQLREYPGWNKSHVAESSVPDSSGTDADPLANYYYLHDSFVATKGVFVDTEIVFDDITPEWIEFCKHSLSFAPPQMDTPASSDGVVSRP